MFDWHQKSSELTPKRIEIYKRLGVEIPKPPVYDDITQQVIQTFILACRGRRYIEAQPLPLRVKDITEVIEAHPIDMPRSMLDYIIFALDDLERAEHNKSNKDN